MMKALKRPAPLPERHYIKRIKLDRSINDSECLPTRYYIVEDDSEPSDDNSSSSEYAYESDYDGNDNDDGSGENGSDNNNNNNNNGEDNNNDNEDDDNDDDDNDDDEDDNDDDDNNDSNDCGDTDSNYSIGDDECDIDKDPEIAIIHRIMSIFNWEDMIYIAIKNSNNEYVTCEDVQNFIRRWFPFFRKKNFLIHILSFMYSHPELFVQNQTTNVNHDPSFPTKWTINHSFTKIIEANVWRTVWENQMYIKEKMEHPESLIKLLIGYGINHLGYRH